MRTSAGTAARLGTAAPVTRRGLVLGGLSLLGMAACSDRASNSRAVTGSQVSPSASSGPGTPSPTGQGGGSGPSALDDPRAPGLPGPEIDTTRLISGGPGPDGIPSIDRPRFGPVGQSDWLADTEPVLAIEIDGVARAYPIAIVIWHEIVNDVIAGVPVAITYCPLCNSALAFDRRVGGRELTFGVSGLLYNSDLVMFDRQTESLWPQIEGRAGAGVLTGAELTRYTVTVEPWGAWRDAHPRGEVLTRETGHTRDYGRNPYPGYDNPGADPFLYDGDLDRRLPPKTRVVGLRSGDDSAVLTLERLEQERVIEVAIAGVALVVWAGPVVASALDDDRVADGRPRATARAFQSNAGSRRLTFRAETGSSAFRDVETGSRWSADGRATAGPLAGARLTPVQTLETLWFAWIAFQPGSRLVS